MLTGVTTPPASFGLVFNDYEDNFKLEVDNQCRHRIAHLLVLVKRYCLTMVHYRSNSFITRCVDAVTLSDHVYYRTHNQLMQRGVSGVSSLFTSVCLHLLLSNNKKGILKLYSF